MAQDGNPKLTSLIYGSDRLTENYEGLTRDLLRAGQFCVAGLGQLPALLPLDPNSPVVQPLRDLYSIQKRESRQNTIKVANSS